MRKVTFVIAALGALALVAGSSLAGASSKFAYTEAITDTGNLSVSFEEAGLKRFDAIDYQLDATASAMYTNTAAQFFPTVSATLSPTVKGRVAGTLVTTLDLSAPSGGICGCGLQRVVYTNVTLTNLTTGHVYRLDSISQTYP